MYGLVIVHEDGAVLSTTLPEHEASCRFEDATKDKSVVYARYSNEFNDRVNWYARP
jgi:hypothetical protein